jgi:hypothetical protein
MVVVAVQSPGNGVEEGSSNVSFLPSHMMEWVVSWLRFLGDIPVL